MRVARSMAFSMERVTLNGGNDLTFAYSDLCLWMTVRTFAVSREGILRGI